LRRLDPRSRTATPNPISSTHGKIGAVTKRMKTPRARRPRASVVAALGAVAVVIGCVAQFTDAVDRIRIWFSPSRRDLLARTSYPWDIGGFMAPSNGLRCVRDAGGSLTIHFAKRARPPGDFGGCCSNIESESPIHVRRGEKLAVELALASPDRVDVKLESHRPGQAAPTTMWLLRNQPQGSGPSRREAVLLWEGADTNVHEVAVNRFCFAIFGERGPASNVLTVRSARLER
jgi:hypothetical protein